MFIYRWSIAFIMIRALRYVYIAFVPTQKAIRYSMNSNGTDLEQVVYTHRTYYWKGWPRGFGEMNHSPHSWIFTSFSVDSSPYSYYALPLRSEYLFTLHSSVAQNLSDIWRATFVIGTSQLLSATEIAPKSRFLYVWTEALVSCMVFLPAQELSGIVWT